MGAAQSSSAAYVPSVSGFGRIGLLLSDVKPSDADDDEAVVTGAPPHFFQDQLQWDSNSKAYIIVESHLVIWDRHRAWILSDDEAKKYHIVFNRRILKIICEWDANSLSLRFVDMGPSRDDDPSFLPLAIQRRLAKEDKSDKNFKPQTPSCATKRVDNAINPVDPQWDFGNKRLQRKSQHLAQPVPQRSSRRISKRTMRNTQHSTKFGTPEPASNPPDAPDELKGEVLLPRNWQGWQARWPVCQSDELHKLPHLFFVSFTGNAVLSDTCIFCRIERASNKIENDYADRTNIAAAYARVGESQTGRRVLDLWYSHARPTEVLWQMMQRWYEELLSVSAETQTRQKQGDHHEILSREDLEFCQNHWPDIAVSDGF